jgi:hypothetical protein
MIFMNRSIYLPFLLFIPLVFSCKNGHIEDDNDNPSSSNPVVTLTSPLQHQDYQKDDTIYIYGTISDSENLHEVEVNVNDITNNAALFHMHLHIHTQLYTVDTFFVVATTQSALQYQVEVKGEDHYGNVGMKQVLVDVNP